jgi:hypothetical protein
MLERLGHVLSRIAFLFVGVALCCTLLSLAGSASERCPAAAPPHNALTALSEVFRGAGAGMSPEVYEQQQRERAAQATYEALLAAGAPEPLACAAALNPQVLQQIAPTYFGRPSR